MKRIAQVVIAVATFAAVLYVLKYKIEPLAIDSACSYLWRC